MRENKYVFMLYVDGHSTKNTPGPNEMENRFEIKPFSKILGNQIY